MSTIAAARTHYDVLGVEPSADATAIKSAFRKAAKLLHPDVSKSDDSEEEFIRVKEAYEILSDDRQRRAYDEQLRQASRRRSSAGASTSGRRGGGAASAAAAGYAAGTRVVIQDEYGNFVEVDIGDLFGSGFIVDDEDDSDDDDDGFMVLDEDDLDYVAWAATSGNFKSSFQASWQSNGRKKRRAKQQQQQAATEAPLSYDEKELLLKELPRQYRAAAQQMFGARLQTLRNLDELAQLVEAVDEINAMGVQFEVMHDEFGNGVGSSGSGSSSRRRTSGGGSGGGSAGGGGGGRRAARGGRGGGGRSSAQSSGGGMGSGGSGRGGGRGRR
ncbi:hypothetical protein HYH02_004474 [Chlamydomonas schloesseri]|uniref:J domain-containing protein n=1 Tax=Chlamydomonas schloesseri TaxID=2026947 RepID=A0A835WNR6_9CHLO|nr:hypothetical protein HYH02_004474 [Chlamydomonas schloesseri]|eukprot:KAG2450634.1 hypothetical protein HYH02_004474 [Chlamydomonas schloesseri]